MIKQTDVERLVEAHERVSKALEEGAPRRAAKILCQEFGWLLDKGSFWNDVKDATETLSEHRAKEREVLLISTLPVLIEAEESIFRRQKIKKERSASILRDVYSSLHLTTDTDNPSGEALEVLRERLDTARDLICKESKGRVGRGLDYLLSWKGVPVIAGTAVAVVNVGGMVHMPTLHHFWWVSTKAGWKVATGNVNGLIDLLG